MTPATAPARGEAGRKGDDVRSDCHAMVELADSGGIRLDLTSRVESYYGDSIREQVAGVMEALGVAHARVTLDDKGGVPFVLQARLEAAVRAAGAGAGRDARAARTAPLPPPTASHRLRRSRLYLPGAEPKFFLNALIHRPDGVILDLEDSVHPEHKDSSRLLVRNALRHVDFGAAERMVRVNLLPLGLADLEAVIPECPDLILIPKVETADQVAQADQVITKVLAGHKIDRPVWLMPILESALGVENAFEIARASRRNVALTIGLEDYTADLGVPKTDDGAESQYARLRLVNAAKACGLQAIDSVYGDVANLDGLRAWALRSRQLGFEGMGCVHPRQIIPIHECFAPGPGEIERALLIVAAFHEAEARGLGVVSLGSKMIDPPVVERARRLVERARTMGLVPGGADGGA